MGVDVHAVRLLALAKREGVDFSRTVTLGRQWLHVDSFQVETVFREIGVSVGSASPAHINSSEPYADALLSLMGASDLVSVDASAYENATVVHDMNLDLPEHLARRFSLLVDCGTLEHVFNFPVAMRNSMRLLEVGGHMAIVTTANNFMGHGFYQFSPELFFRVLSPENGYRVERMFLSEVRAKAPWYELADPAAIGQRVDLVNNAPSYLLILARRISDVTPLASAPLQSDYEQISWQAGGRIRPASRGAFLRGLRRFAPAWLEAAAYRVRAKVRPSFPSPCYRRVGKDLR